MDFVKNKDKLKVVIIGFGHIAQYQIEALSTLKQFELCAIVDIDETIYSPHLNIPFFNNIDLLCKNINFDLAIISTSNNTHFEIAKKLIKCNKNILIEKPSCNNMKELEILIELTIYHKTKIFFALHAMYGSEVLWFLKNIHISDFGTLSSFHSYFFDPYINNSILSSSAYGLDGSWQDSGINALSILYTFMQTYKLTFNNIRLTNINIKHCSNLQAIAEYNFQINDYYGTGIIETNWTLNLNKKLTKLYFAETNSTIILDHSEESILILKQDKIQQTINLKNQYPRLTNHYINLFQDLYYNFKNESLNIEYIKQLHNLFFIPLSKIR